MAVRDALIVILPAGDGAPHWSRVIDETIVQSGVGTGWLAACGLQHWPADAPVMLVVPSALTALHWIAFPDRPVRQARAAAQLTALDASIGSADTLMAAADTHDDPARPYVVAVVARADMQHWLLWAQQHGLDPDYMVPAALLLPQPDGGFIRGVVGDTTLVRGETVALVADDPLADALIGETAVVDVSASAIKAAMIAALDAPPLTLRQGDFAKRRRVAIDRRQVARIAVWCGAIALASLMMALISIIRLHGDAERLDADSVAVASAVLPGIQDAAQAEEQADAQLAQRGSGAYGFIGPAAGLFTAMQGAPGVSLTLLDRGQDGLLHATLASVRAEDINVVLLALQASGFTITATSSSDPSGRVLAEITVRS